MHVCSVLGVCDLTDGFAFEVLNALFFGLFQQLIQFFIAHGKVFAHILREKAIMEGERVSVSVLKLARLNILPSCLNDWHTTFVDGFRVRLSQLTKLNTRDELSIDLLGLHLPEYLSSQRRDLLNELRPQALIVDVVQHLQLLLLLDRSDNRMAVSILEEVAHETSDPILLLDRITHSLLLLE